MQFHRYGRVAFVFEGGLNNPGFWLESSTCHSVRKTDISLFGNLHLWCLCTAVIPADWMTKPSSAPEALHSTDAALISVKNYY
jgi:hypothetical protein